MLYHPIMAGIFETDDSRELLTELTGACATLVLIFFNLRKYRTVFSLVFVGEQMCKGNQTHNRSEMLRA